MKKILFMLLVLISTVGLSACQYDENKIVLGEGDWQSYQFYNQVVKFIVEEGYDVEVDIKLVDTPLLIQTLTDGSVDANVELWAGNVPTYDDDIESGKYIEAGVNFNDNYQGIYIPKYLADEYDIEYITDLADHKELFADPEVTNWDADSDKGVIYGGPSGWAATSFFIAKFANSEVYPELVENFEFRPLESSALLDTTLTSAYNDEEPWAGYNWEPTTIMGLFDMVLLKDDEPFDAEAGTGNLPTNDVTVNISNQFNESYPELTVFFSNFSTSSQVASDALAYMSENELSAEETAKWWLENYVDMWSTWVSVDAKNKILEKLEV